jgi:hypothetical protein
METGEHRSVAAATYNRSWELLESSPRTDEHDAELLTCAFTSRYHWSLVGTREQSIMADWMVSRAAAAVGESAIALSFAHRADAAAQDPTTSDWLVASTAEGVARAFASAGDHNQAALWTAKAEALVARIADEEDRELIAEQLASVPREG